MGRPLESRPTTRRALAWARQLRVATLVPILLMARLANPLAAQQPTTEPAAAPSSAPASNDPRPAADAPRGLLGIAEKEAARSSRALRESILGKLKKFAETQETAADRGKTLLDAVVTLGPDAVPLLLEVLRDVDRGALDSSFAGAAARALCGIFERTRSKEILARLDAAVKGSGPAVKQGALDGLAQLDHPQVIEIVAPLLASGDATLVARAVRVLGHQQSSAETVAPQLRPLLDQQGAPLADVVTALDALGDTVALDSIHGLAAKSEDPVVLLACVRYLSRLGTRASIAPLGKLLLRPEGALPETLLKQGIDAVQGIGLRLSDAHAGAEELLLDVYKKLRATRTTVSTYARWQLGPYKTDDALKSLEDELEQAIAANKRMNQSNVARYIDLAKARLRFEAWNKAVSALDKAKDEDTRRNRTDDIEQLRAVGFCGQAKYSAAEKLLQEIDPKLRLELLQEYPVLQKMAREPRYKELFPAGE